MVESVETVSGDAKRITDFDIGVGWQTRIATNSQTPD